MSWIIVMLLVLIIILLSICIYLDIGFTATFTSSEVPNTSSEGTSALPPVTTLPVTTAKQPSTTKAPGTVKLPNTQTPQVTTTPKPVLTTVPITTTQTPLTTTTPVTTENNAPTICIDPGHGFGDPGATYGNYKEKDITLAISLKLKDELIALGYNVIMTHDGVNYPESTYLSQNANGDPCFYVNERNRWIRNHASEIDLVISIHCDSAAPSASGTRYYIMEYGTDYYLPQSEQLARSLCNAVANAFDKTPPANKYNTTTEFAILKTSIPSVLVESLFMSNSGDLQKLIDPEWQSKFAKALAQGINNHLTK